MTDDGPAGQRSGRGPAATEMHVCLSTLLTDPMRASAEDVLVAVDTAADAGFEGVSVWTLHHAICRPGDDDPLAERLRRRELQSPVVEAMAGWANATDAAAVRADAEFAIGVAQALGATHLVAVCLEAELADPAVTAQNLALAASMAADAGLRIAVEFLPWSGIPTLRRCVDLIDQAGADNVGVLLDTWHWVRQPGGPDVATLASLDGAMIPLLQICDTGEAMDDQYVEATTARRVPGEGEVDFGELFAVLRRIGAEPIISPEVFDVASLTASPDRWPRQMAQACRDVLHLREGLGPEA